MRIRRLSIAVLGIAWIHAGCGNRSAPAATRLEWQLANRTLSYAVTARTGFAAPSGPTTNTSSFQLVLDQGKAQISRDGQAVGEFALDASGGLVRTSATASLLPPELDVLAIADTTRPAIAVGAQWSRLDPSDADVAAHQDRLVFQSRRDYKITRVGPGGTVELDVTGWLRIVDTQGGRDFVTRSFPGADQPGTGVGSGSLLDALGVLTHWTQYLTGTITFDSAKGELVTFDGAMIFDIAPTMDSARLRSSQDRDELVVARR